MTQICRITLGNGVHLVAHWTYDDQSRPVTVATMTCAVTGADAGRAVYGGHMRSEYVVTLAVQVNRHEAVAAAAPVPEPLAFDLYLTPSA